MASIPIMAESFPRDRLTGLPTTDEARAFLSAWAGEADGDRPAPIHAMLLGLGRFDTINLAYGEATGDGALVAVAQRLLHFAQDEFENGDWFVARIGGGQFVLAAREACSRERWYWLAEALADLLSHPIGDAAGAGTVRLWPRFALMRALPGEGAQAVMDRLAGTLTTVLSRQGCRMLWVDRETPLLGRRDGEIDADLLAALDRNEIEILFQPQFAMEDNRLYGAEALARWRHPRLGRIGATSLFAIAERADHVAHLSRHLIERALDDATAWPEDMTVSLNATASDLASQGFAAGLLDLISACGLTERAITLEITEQVLLSDLERSAASLSVLADAGVRIALDDFGAGFCNFRYLKTLPLHDLKLDRSMIEGIGKDARDLAVLRGIVAMAKALELQVAAEGIETQDQLDILRNEGIDRWQGFLGAKPMSADGFSRFCQTG